MHYYHYVWKGHLIFFLSGQSALPQRRLFMYVCPPNRFSDHKATAVLKGIFCRSKWHWLILSLTSVFIKMGCILPSKRQGLHQLLNNKPMGMLWGLYHLPFKIFSSQGVFWWPVSLNLITDVILLKQATSRFKHSRPRLVHVCRWKTS